mgnify:CR=1 FL=1
MRKILSPAFFNRSTFSVARELLGKFLVRKWHGKEIAAMITEVEAYDGFRDRASHASHGMTARNKPMFGPAGRWYAYFTYGMHWMLNIVTREHGYPAAILIRGINIMTSEVVILNGPAKLTKFLHINGMLSGKITSRKSGLWIEDRGVVVRLSQIARFPRIGVDYAGKEWAEKPYRFQIKNEERRMKN